MTTIFVTSSGTDIGKTYVSAMLIRQLRAKGLPVQALKPIVSGVDEATFPDSDPAALLAALGEEVSFDNIDLLSRWVFEPALSPDMAAARAGVEIDFRELVDHCKARAHLHDPLIIEGVGGRTRLDESAQRTGLRTAPRRRLLPRHDQPHTDNA